MTKIAVELSYTACTQAILELPEGKTWDDVADCYAKWGTLYVQFKGATDYQEFDCGYIDVANIDTKYPDHVRVWETMGEHDKVEADYDRALLDD